MDDATLPPICLEGVGRIWLGPAGPEPQVRLFRRTVQTPVAPRRVLLDVFAETSYQLHVNGRWAQRWKA